MKKILFLSPFIFLALQVHAQSMSSTPSNNTLNSHVASSSMANDGAHQAALNIDFDKTNINDIVNSKQYSQDEKIQIYHQYNRLQKAKLLAQKQELINLMKKAHEEHELTHQPIDEQEKANIIQKRELFKQSVEQFKEQNRNFKISLGMPLNHPKNHELHEHALPHGPEAPNAKSGSVITK